jgi:hypothetical protein
LIAVNSFVVTVALITNVHMQVTKNTLFLLGLGAVMLRKRK